MRILLSALSLLLLFSGCATVDGEPVAEESVAAGAATWNPRAGHADKKFMNLRKQLRDSLRIGDEKGVRSAHGKIAELVKEDDMNPLMELVDSYFLRGRLNKRRNDAHKIATDMLVNEMLRPGSTKPPSAEEAVRLGLIQPQELIPGLQIQEDYARLIPGAGLTPLQYEVVKSRQAHLSKSVWPGEEAQETTSNQRDETSDFSQTWSDQQQESVFQQPQQLIPTPGGRALLGPITPNAYGPGLNSDATGRPFMWTPQSGGSGHPDSTLRVQPNAYGLGIGMDQYGRPVTPGCMPGWVGPC